MHNKQGSVFFAAVLLLACQGAAAGETKPAKAVGVAIPPEASNSVSSVSSLGGNKGGGAASASYAREASSGEGDCASAPDPTPTPAPQAQLARDSTPARISTNVTTPKQTQGATFGEKVNQGLHSAGGALAQGAAPVGTTVPGGAVISSRCAKVPQDPPMETGASQTQAATDK